MATILTFRDKERVSSTGNFLTDETEKLSFKTSEDGAVSLGEMSRESLPKSLPDPRKDWRNQELADLFRVRELLIGAGVQVETMRGITDEGDPWFIFCHFNGDVFIHMARIDGLYVLDSPNVRRPLRGADFNALIADFTNDALPTLQNTGDDGDTKRRVVRLERGGKVRLHPSAMLAALIWTLFLASEELVLLTPEDQAAAEDDLLDFSDMIFPASFEIHTVETESADIAGLTSGDTAQESSSEILNTEAQIQIRDAASGQQGLSMHQNSFAMGLSTIAIAMGFMSEAVLLDNQRKVLDGLKSIGFMSDGVDAEHENLTDIAEGEQDSAFLAKLAEFLGIDLTIGDEQAEVAEIDPKTSVLQNDLTHLDDEILTADEGLAPAPKVIPPSAFHAKNADTMAPVEVVEETSGTADFLTTAKAGETATSENEAMGTKISGLVEAIQAWQQTQAKELHIVGVFTTKADLDMTISDAYALFTLGDKRSERSGDVLAEVSIETPTASTFDPMSQRLIDFFTSKGGDIGIIDQENGFLAVDRQAVKSGDVTYMEWETDDGKLIGLIGFASDFQQFDMIA